MSRFYVTTPIYYVNDVPHLGTSYTTIAADAIRRYHLLRGDETRMLTGTDEHGLKIEREAHKRGLPPLEFATQMSARFRELWPQLEIAPDDFIRTTEKRHEDLVQELWRVIAKKGDLYAGTYEDWYCVDCESYKTEKELLPGNLCPLHLKPVERLKEETYFFRLSKYAGPLLRLYSAHPEFIRPESRRNEVVRFVEGGLRDLSVSRTSFRWGVPVPDDPKHVMFVWFDALANYWTAVQDSESHKKFWTDGNVVHIVGKDILRFHAVYWPAFLMSAGIRLPDCVYAHGFLTYSGQKMSKTLRNVVNPLAIARAFGRQAGSDAAGADVLRYHLLSAISFGQDGDFDLAAMVERYNADLGKNLGNLLSRTLGLCAKLTDGKVPVPADLEKDDQEFRAQVHYQVKKVAEAWHDLRPGQALNHALELCTAANVYVDRTAPWEQAKRGRPERVNTILALLLDVLETISVMIWPVLPAKSGEMRTQLGLAPLAPGGGRDMWPKSEAGPWRPAGELLEPGAPLFRTFDEDATRALLTELTPAIEEASQPRSGIADGTSAEGGVVKRGDVPSSAAAVTYDQFSAVDLRVGVVRSCVRVPKKDKLLRLEVDLGETALRTIVAGLALSFQPEQLVGKRVVVVANLAPREFGKGLVSHGMLLATGPSEKLTLATVDEDVAAGSKLK
jgi:methionyl-tRNA synthetase